jgi:predicted nucleotidyltransferase
MQSNYDRIQYYKIGQQRKKGIIAKLKKLFADNKQVKLAWLFGSVTRRDSVRDIDVAIHADPEFEFEEFLDLNVQIELELRIPVDLVEIAKVPISLKENILRTGTLLKGTITQ